MLGKDKGTWMITDVEGQKDEIAKAAGIPSSEILDIADALKDADLPITLGNIKDLYDRRKQK
jgi:formylmethanofuran dehydrogenase subunit B